MRCRKENIRAQIDSKPLFSNLKSGSLPLSYTTPQPSGCTRGGPFSNCSLSATVGLFITQVSLKGIQRVYSSWFPKGARPRKTLLDSILIEAVLAGLGAQLRGWQEGSFLSFSFIPGGSYNSDSVFILKVNRAFVAVITEGPSVLFSFYFFTG